MTLYDKSKDKMLIDLVSKRPILYSSSHPQHRNYIEKHRAWEEISAILDTPIPGLKQRWKHFRDHYHKKKKQTPKRTEWKYMSLLSFLSNPKNDVVTSENKTEKKEMEPKPSTVTRNDSSDFSNVSEFENEGSESASSIGSFSYEQAEWKAKCTNTDDDAAPLYKEIINQTDHKHPETTKEMPKMQTLIMDKILKSFKLPGSTPSSSNQKPSEIPSGKMSLGFTTNPNNPEKSKDITIEQTSEPGVSEANSEAKRKWLESMERIGKNLNMNSNTKRIKSSPLPPIGPVHRFYESVAEVVSMFPPHLISEAKLAIHKSIYQIERECLGLKEDDDESRSPPAVRLDSLHFPTDFNANFHQ